ncbi:hypothetical protein C8R45DRAFT_1041091 [Mycena sanguinolenta]|nr:hypothetical protein C8R45DRAFT_1041091 [Mycena sanguinolenta]
MGHNPFIPRKRSTIALTAFGVLLFVAVDVWLYPRSPVIKAQILRAPSPYGGPEEFEPVTESCQFNGVYTYFACIWDSTPAFVLVLIPLAFVVLAWYLRSRYMTAEAPVEVLFEVDHHDGGVQVEDEKLEKEFV